MPQKSEFKIISGDGRNLEKELAPLAAKNWRPILITSAGVSVPPQGVGIVVVTIVLEHLPGS
ncbi:MAG: hypothetical protein ABSB82_13025 [Terriglobia bacterium]|jgi:hypothetical protein